jgi:hypothetical protein
VCVCVRERERGVEGDTVFSGEIVAKTAGAQNVTVQSVGLWKCSSFVKGIRDSEYRGVRLLGLRLRTLPEACLFVSCVMCCEIEVYATGRSLVQRSPIDCVCVNNNPLHVR